MTITTAATATPIAKPNSVAAFVNSETGALSEHGVQLLNNWYNSIVGMNRVTPCNASGTNVITLTPLTASPLIEKYSDYELYAFKAENTSTGAVTMTVAPKTGTLATLKVYKQGGLNQAGTGNVNSGRMYLALYADYLDSGAGGFILFTAHPDESMRGLYEGFTAGSYDSTKLYFNPGVISNSSGTAIFHAPLVLMVDVSTVGINTSYTPPDATYSTICGGMAEGAVANPSPLSFYAVTRNTDGAVTVLASSYTTYGDVAPYVPSGWTICRKLHFEVVYNTARGANWAGIPDFFQDVRGTRVLLSGAAANSNYRILNAGTATSTTVHSAAAFVADACRTILVQYQASATGSAGTTYVKSGVGTFPVAEVYPGENVYGEMTIKLNGGREFEYFVTGGASLTLYLKGYWFDEPT